MNCDIFFRRTEEANIFANLDAPMDVTNDSSQLNVFVWVRFAAHDGKLRRMLDSPLSQSANLAHTKRTFPFGQKRKIGYVRIRIGRNPTGRERLPTCSLWRKQNTLISIQLTPYDEILAHLGYRRCLVT
jgi:hypothetical protein